MEWDFVVLLTRAKSQIPLSESQNLFGLKRWVTLGFRSINRDHCLFKLEFTLLSKNIQNIVSSCLIVIITIMFNLARELCRRIARLVVDVLVAVLFRSVAQDISDVMS